VNQLFIRLYLDEDVDVLVATLLRARGFEATTTLEAKNVGATDAAQLAHAVEQDCALLTHNRADFEELASEYLARGQKHHGMIIAVRRTPYELARRLLEILNQVTADEMVNQIRYI
jgi:predicted nuclease of predicted toxin-antitoxin system